MAGRASGAPKGLRRRPPLPEGLRTTARPRQAVWRVGRREKDCLRALARATRRAGVHCLADLKCAGQTPACGACTFRTRDKARSLPAMRPGGGFVHDAIDFCKGGPIARDEGGARGCQDKPL
jgi:hypothetical protein